MPISGLTNDENETIRRCLRAALEGPFFAKWEFQTLVGASHEEVRVLSARWPNHDDQQRALTIAIGVVNNLLGYPHDSSEVLRTFVEASPAELGRLLKKMSSYARGNGPTE